MMGKVAGYWTNALVRHVHARMSDDHKRAVFLATNPQRQADLAVDWHNRELRAQFDRELIKLQAALKDARHA